MTTVPSETRAVSRNLQKHTNPNPLHRWLLRRFHGEIAALVTQALARSPGTNRRVLEVGSGEGYVTNFLAARAPEASFFGLELRREALVLAKVPGVGTTCWLQGDALRLPFQDASVPVVVCAEVLEHLPDPWAALGEMRRVCSGSLILSVPNQPLFSLANFLRGKNLRTLGEDPEHLQHWRGATFIRLVRQHTSVQEIRYSFPWIIAVSDLGAAH